MSEARYLQIVKPDISPATEADFYLHQVEATLSADFDAPDNSARRYDRRMAMNLARLVAPHIEEVRTSPEGKA